jgi:serine/threonine protein kinase
MLYQLPQAFGRYTLLTKLGAGGMGTVFEADDPTQRQRVALKIPHDQEDANALQRFRREASLARRIKHPNLCPIIEDGQIGGMFYFTMPLLQGQSLYQKRKPGATMPVAEAVKLGQKIALAMHELHRFGIMHRDLKPANIMLKPGGEPVIMDFGLARSLDGGDRVTRTGAMMGSPAYMCPEQFEGDASKMGPAGDIFSLGVVLYELVTGMLPFPGSHPGAIFAALLRDNAKLPSSHRPALEALDPIIMKALQKAPADRYGSMAEFAAVLDAFAARQELKGLLDQSGVVEQLTQAKKETDERLRQALEKQTQLQAAADGHRKARDEIYQKAQTILARLKQLEAEKQHLQERCKQEQQGRLRGEHVVQQATEIIAKLHQQLTALPRVPAPTVASPAVDTRANDPAPGWKPTPAEGVPNLPQRLQTPAKQPLPPLPDDDGDWVLEESQLPAQPRGESNPH